ncbi:CGNR zinc finger domain-containing protein [Actinomadura sp. NBRC 104412]|uniref:CGNR zinc finger domain-containing protein n=1 Tax=Actinomadura sp. NBRC 104412 TaxID=3032203 RepID=UPI00331AF445
MRRLKICCDASCVAAFYDRTRNNNGVWHSTRSCGNPPMRAAIHEVAAAHSV